MKKFIKEEKECPNCSKTFITKRSTQLYCSFECSKVKNKERIIESGLEDISPGTIGAISELIVAADLMKNGFEVYRALSPSSDCDLIAIKGEEIRKYEVRSGRYYRLSNGKIKITKSEQQKKGKLMAILTHSDGLIHYIDE